MKKIIPILLFICIVAPVFAQVKVHIGATTSVNSTFVLDKGLAEDPRYNAQMTYKWAPAGLAFGVDFNQGLGLQLESILSRQGQIYQIIDVAEKQIGERKIDLEYIHLPFMLNLLSSSASRASFNFMFGPQLSLLTQGQEIYQQSQSGILVLPEGAQLPANATNYDSQKRTYNAPPSTTIIASTDATSAIQKFKDKEMQLAVSFGLNIDIGSQLYLSANLRGNYGFTDMRNDELIQSIKNSNNANTVVKDLFGRRANLLIGVQMGLHYMIGGNRASIRNMGSVRK